MKLFGLNIPTLLNRKSKIETQKSISPAMQAWLRGEDVDHAGSVLTNAYEQVVWVYRAINVLAEQSRWPTSRSSFPEASAVAKPSSLPAHLRISTAAPIAT